MKLKPKLIAFIVILLFTFSNIQAQVIYLEDFNDGMPANINLGNLDGLTPHVDVSYVNDAWIVRDDFVTSDTDSCAFSTSWYDPAGTANDWLITPSILLDPDTNVLEWKSMAPDSAFPDGYIIYISTLNSISSLIANPIFTVTADTNAWKTRSVGLPSQYYGQAVHIAFRNNSVDQFLLMLDDITVKIGDLVPEPEPTCSADPFFSEYIEGTGLTKSLEIYNPSASNLDMADYQVNLYANGSATPTTILGFPSNTILPPGEAYSIAHPGAPAPLLALSDTAHLVTNFNGNDAIAIFNLISGDTVDIFGTIGSDPGFGWILNGTNGRIGVSSEFTLIRDSSIGNGQLNWSIGKDNEWVVENRDDYSNIGLHSSICKSGPEICESPDPIFTSRIMPNAARFNWATDSSSQSYQIRGRLLNSSSLIYINVPGGGNSFKDISGLGNNVTYVWQIRKFCSTGDTSAWSGLDTFTAKCTTPANIWTSDITSNSARFNWTKVNGVDGYIVRGRINNGTPGSWVNLDIPGANTTSKDVLGLGPNKTYEWKVRAVCDLSNGKTSDYTSILSFTTSSSARLSGEVDPFQNNTEREIIISPNPFSQICNINFVNPEHHNYTLKVKDISGKTIRTVNNIRSEEYILQRDNWSSGIYFIELHGPQIYRSKVILD